MAWMEALDVGSGRLYFIRLADNTTSWEQPEGFLTRKELVTAHAQLLQSSTGDEASFMARVRERFPPPVAPPPASAAPELEEQVRQLTTQVEQLMTASAAARSEKLALEATVERLSAGGCAEGDAPPPSCVAPPMLGTAAKMPGGSWKRGASAKWGALDPPTPPPPPPEWAVQMSRGASSHGSSKSLLGVGRNHSGAI